MYSTRKVKLTNLTALCGVANKKVKGNAFNSKPVVFRRIHKDRLCSFSIIQPVIKLAILSLSKQGT